MKRFSLSFAAFPLTMADSVHHSRLLCWHSVRKQDVFDVARQKHQTYIMTNSSSWRWSMFAVTFMFHFFFLTKALSIGGSCDQDYVHQDVSLMNRRWCWRSDWTRKRRFSDLISVLAETQHRAVHILTVPFLGILPDVVFSGWHPTHAS